MGCTSSQEISADVRVDTEFEEVSTGLASRVAWDDMSTRLASPITWDGKERMDSPKAKKMRFDGVSPDDGHLKQCTVEHKAHLRDPMTCGTMEDIRTFVETFPTTLEMKVELKRYRDFGRPKTRAKSS